MEGKPKSQPRAPWWFILIVLLSILPVAAWPLVLTNIHPLVNEGNRIFLMVFPVYAVLTGYISYRIYRGRREVSWILLALLWLSYGAVPML